MQIQVNSDHNTKSSERLAEYVRAVVLDAVDHFGDHVTRIEVHMSDQNGPKAGADDKRCMMEARLERQPPIAVTHRAETLDLAISGAAGKLRRSLEHSLGRIQPYR